MRGTPLLVQLFLIYYGLAQFEAVRASLAWPWLRSPWFCAVLAFALNTGAYTTEILAGAIRAVPAGEIEAARAYGMAPRDAAAASCCRRRCAVRCRPTATRWC
jgi:arginine/ornithine transport system permease protein